MAPNFDLSADRYGTDSVKWELSRGGAIPECDAHPLWLGEMDFAVADEIKAALLERAAVPNYGYTWKSDASLDHVVRWVAKSDWSISRSWISITPGILNTIAIAIRTLTSEGDSIIVDSPIYPPIHQTIRHLKRGIIFNELELDDEGYRRSFVEVQKKVTSSTRMYITCNPSNPTGKMWSLDDLKLLGNFCIRNNLLMISDEIYSDLCFSRRHCYLASLSPEIAERSIVCLSPSKAFCLSGLQTASIVIPNRDIRNRIVREREYLHLSLPNSFGLLAQNVAYSQCDYWLIALLDYLQGNLALAFEKLEGLQPRVRAIRPEGTFLLWLDCRGLGMENKKFCSRLYEETGILVSDGEKFGPNGKGFIRVCFGMPRRALEDALNLFVNCVRGMTI